MYVVRLKQNRERSLLHRHPWVFSGAVESVDGEPTAGEVVTVVGADGTFLGRGYYNGRSNMRVRILEWREDVEVDACWWKERIASAIARRGDPALLLNAPEASATTNAYRLVHAEADLLPGLIVDRYADFVVVQFLTAGTERVRDVVVNALDEQLSPSGILDRSDADTRKKEGLQPATGLISGRSPDGPVEVLENGFRFLVDFSTGQKTGFYLDQRDNRTAVSRYAAGRRVLDAFSYTGAFSVYAAKAGAAGVTLVESSGTAIELARQNLKLNGVDDTQVEMQQADVFEALRKYRDAGARFDMVILDPPKFARTKVQAEKAMRGYKDINLLAMKLLTPGGILASFSCSGGVDIEAFTLAVSWAGLDADRDVQVLQRLGQPADHPVLASFPESEYLKGLICRIVE